jgi:uncharacterized protein YbjT (DUF2867 family)
VEGRIERILVYGATGSQGSPVARRLLEAGFGVRALTRDPEGAAWLSDAGAEVVAGDLGDRESVRAASEGVDAVFLLVPFFNREADGGLGYGRNAIDAAKEAGVRLLVWNPSGEIPAQKTGNPGFDVRVEVLEHLKASGVPYVVLQPTAYMENFLGPWTAPEVAEKGVFAYPTPNDVKMQWIATEDVALYAVEAMKNPGVANLNLKVSGPERLNGEEVAERFGRALGRRITFRAMPPGEFGEIIDQAFPGMGKPAAKGYEMAYEAPEMFSTNVDLDAALEKLPIKPTTLEEWVRRHAGAFTARTAAPSA